MRAMAITTTTVSRVGKIPRRLRRHSIRAALLGSLARLHEWRRRSRDRAELAKFDERMLRDIGLSRADAWLEVNKPFWRK